MSLSIVLMCADIRVYCTPNCQMNISYILYTTVLRACTTVYNVNCVIIANIINVSRTNMYDNARWFFYVVFYVYMYIYIYNN